MRFKVIITLLFLGFILQSYCQVSLVGNWRRVNPYINNQDLKNNQPQWGDLTLRSDSTFHIQGDTATLTSTIRGWHAGSEYTGTWGTGKNETLFLWYEPKEDKMFFAYFIVKLTRDKLVVRSTFSKKRGKKNQIVYVRL